MKEKYQVLFFVEQDVFENFKIIKQHLLNVKRSQQFLSKGKSDRTVIDGWMFILSTIKWLNPIEIINYITKDLHSIYRSYYAHWLFRQINDTRYTNIYMAIVIY